MLLPDFTERGRAILPLIAAGANNQEIAQHLAISNQRVSNLISNIGEKSQVAGRAQTFVKAQKTGVGES